MKTTFSRTFYPAAIILLAALLLVGAAIQVLIKDYISASALSDMKSDGAAIADLAAAYDATEGLANRNFLIDLSLAGKVSGSDVVICDTKGRLLICSDAPLGCSHQGMSIRGSYLKTVLAEGSASGTGTVGGLYDEDRYVVSQTITDSTGNIIGIVILSKPISQTIEVLRRMSNVYLYAALLAVLVGIVLIHYLVRRHSAPLQEMARVASDFGHGKLNSRVKVDKRSSQEMQELSLAFNNMAQSLQKIESQRQDFVANVSHELKTPMTTISGYIDGMLDGTIPPEKHKQYMVLVSEETKRLSRLVRSMLDISQLQEQGGMPEEKKSRFDVEECAGQVLISFEKKITDKDLTVEVDMPAHPVYTFAGSDAITQVLYNLLDNAVKFCPEKGQMGISIRNRGEKIYVSVFNDGPTIPPEELPMVFDRFHKLDKSRSKNRDGWGLGLYIVKTIIGCHGEDISVTSKNGRTEFTFTLPLVN